MPQARLSRIRHAASYAALGALLGVVSLTLSQCTQVGDSLTGVSRLSSKRVSCKHECDKTFDALEKVEKKLHQNNLKQCNGPSSQACRAAENARYDAAIEALEKQEKACKATCHKQGGGREG